MSDFFAELKRRHVYRVGAAYVVVAWALTQLVEILTQVYTLPLWTAQAAIALLAIGFPVALLVTWTIESKPHQAVAAAVRSKPTIVDWTLCGALALVLIFMGYQQIAPSSEATRQAGVEAAKEAAASQTAVSLAVLPFVNLTSDKEQEYFSDGMTEEITSALAKVQNLRVVGRTSAFQFKGENKDLRAIGQALGASHLIEGSVRKDGNQVRITAQLIKADDGTHLWTESYNRELNGVFALQEEIASAIAGALQVPLGLGQGETLVSNRTDDLESYQQYLRARALYRARDVGQAIAVLVSVIARDPGFAPARALLAQVNVIKGAYEPGIWVGPLAESRRKFESWVSEAETAAREAIRLDARHVGGYAALAYVQAVRKNWAAADELFRQAYALDPDDLETLHLHGLMLASSGRLKQALSVREQLRALEPFVPVYNIFTAWAMQANGQNEASIKMLEATPPGGPVGLYRNVWLARGYAAAGRYADAADTLLAIPQEQTSVTRRSVEDAARILRSAPAKTSAPETLPVLETDLNFVYAHIGAESRVFEAPERFTEIGGGAFVITSMWYPLYAPLRKTERFKAYLRANGLVDYWREHGWPDLCRPVGADDFLCD